MPKRILRVLFSPFGSLGDLHPYMALAHELQRRGHQAVIATFEAHRDAVTSAGIEFAAVRPNTDTFGSLPSVVQRLFTDRSGVAFLVRDMFMAHIAASYEDLNRVAAGCDLIVTHPIGYAGPLVAQKRGLPWASSVLAPMSIGSCIAPPILGGAPWLRHVRVLGVTPYRWMFALAKRAIAHWEKPLRALREQLHLPPAPSAIFEGQYSPQLNLALFSPLLAEPQADWPANTVLCGFPRYDGPPVTPAVQARLQDFLAAGEPPLVFALGSSAVMIAGDFWHHAIAAAQALRRRAILLTGDAPSLPDDLPPTVQAYEYLPYSAVFPHACAVIHQAGIGTLAQALAAGRPQLIVPVAFDQPDNAARAVALGLARTLPFKKVTPDRLTHELALLLKDNRYAQRAASVAATIQAEDALCVACDTLEALLR